MRQYQSETCTAFYFLDEDIFICITLLAITLVLKMNKLKALNDGWLHLIELTLSNHINLKGNTESSLISHTKGKQSTIGTSSSKNLIAYLFETNKLSIVITCE